MKELKPSGLFYVPVPMDAFNFGIPKQETENLFYELKGCLGCELIKLPKGKWELIGSVTAEHIDFDVEPYTNAIGFQGKEIFLQMLKANDVHFVNPYGEKPDMFKYPTSFMGIHRFRKDLEKWLEAESKLVEKILILKPL